MTDPLDKLQNALRKAAPEPDAAHRRADLAQAQEIFARTQGNDKAARHTSDRHAKTGFGRIMDMLTTNKMRPFLLSGSSLAVITLGFVLVNSGTMDRFTRPLPAPVTKKSESSDVALNRAEPVQESEALLDAAPAPAVAPSMRQTLGLDKAFREDDTARDRALAANDMVRNAPVDAAPIAEMTAAPETTPRITTDREVYPDSTPDGLKITADNPVSTFSIDVDTTSYTLLRSAIQGGYDIPKDAVRVEEMVNYFDYSYPLPDRQEQPFSVSASITATPWNEHTQLVQIGLKGYEVPTVDRAPMALVFLIDTSGSMQDTNKLPLLIKSFDRMLGALRADDQIAIVTYAGSAGVVLEPTPAADRSTISMALGNLRAGGSTAGGAGLERAYALAEEMADGGAARVILATDGDFNVGISGADALTDYIAEKRESGTHLSVLGFGRGNYNDATMQALAQNGNGVAAYIDTLAEAQRVLVDDISSSLVTIASDVKIQVEFNPAQISEYQLLGYETRALNREDFNNDRVDAGEIGAGHTVTAIYEITRTGSPGEMTDPLRYGDAVGATDTSDELAFVKLRYKLPGEAKSTLLEMPITDQTNSISATDAGYAAAVAGVARLARSEDLGGWGFADALALAQSNRGTDEFGYRAEFVGLLRLLAQ